jgi:hypothetical protein
MSRSRSVIVSCPALLLLLAGCAGEPDRPEPVAPETVVPLGTAPGVPKEWPGEIELPIVARWSGDFSVDFLEHAPENLRDQPLGYFDDPVVFGAVWQALVPGRAVPQVNFGESLVVFVQNLNSYHRVKIDRVELTDGEARVVALEAVSARPAPDRIALALAVLPRAGVRALRLGPWRVEVAER